MLFWNRTFQLGLKSKIFLVLAAQIFTISLFLVTTNASRVSDLAYPGKLQSLDVANRIGKFAFFRSDGDYHLKITGDNLAIENGRLGIFRTYAHKTVRIENLSFKLSPTEPEHIDHSDSGISANHLSIQRFSSDVMNSFAPLFERYWSGSDWKLNLDASNLSSISINGFSYKIYDEQEEVFTVSSRKASICHKGLPLLLEGRVIIQLTPDQQLRAQKVKWDIENEIFVVDGSGILIENGLVTPCENIEINYGSYKHISVAGGW